MSSCEKCWLDSGGDSARYEYLTYVRKFMGRECTPEQQAGLDAKECPVCHRNTLHQYTREPMCGCKPSLIPTTTGD